MPENSQGVRNGKSSLIGLLATFMLIGFVGCQSFSKRVGENFVQTGVSTAAYNLADKAMNGPQRTGGQRQIPKNVYWTGTGYLPIPGYAFVNPCGKGLGAIKIEGNEEFVIRTHKECLGIQ